MEKLTELFKKYEKLSKMPGAEKFPSPLDTTPEEWEALTRIRRPKHQQEEITIPTVPEVFSKVLPPQEIERRVASFWEANKAEFDSQKDISYLADKDEIYFKGDKDILKKLLVDLGIKEEAQRKILSGKKVYSPPASGTAMLDIPISKLYGVTLEDVELQVKIWKSENKADRAKVSNPSISKDGSVLIFPVPDREDYAEIYLENFLKTLGVQAEAIKRIIERIPEYKR